MEGRRNKKQLNCGLREQRKKLSCKTISYETPEVSPAKIEWE